MKNRFFLFLLLILVPMLFACQKETSDPITDTFTKALDTYKAHKSITYELQYIYKYHDIEHLTTINATIKALHNEKENRIGGYFFAEREDGRKIIYNGNKIYNIRPSEEKIFEYSDTEAIEHTLDNGIASIYIASGFLRSESFMARLKDSTHTFEIIQETDTLTTIKETMPDEGENIKREQIYYFDKKLSLFNKISYQHLYHDSVYKKEWNFNDICFDKYKQIDLDRELQICLNTYPQQEYKPIQEHELELLPLGSTAPNITGLYYQENMAFDLSQIKDKVILLDFWFIDCPYCVKAMPTLHELYNKHKDDDFVILGINRRDNTPRGLTRIDVFLKKYNMNYPVILGENSLKPDSLYHIKYYPSFYVLDKNKKVAFRSIGYDDEIITTIEKLLGVGK